MDPTAQTLERLEARDFDAIEDEWLERLDTHPTDTPYFIAVAVALADSSHIESVRPLLRLVDEELAQREALEERLGFLVEAGHLFLRPNALYESVVDGLRLLYAQSTSLGDMLRISGLHQKPGDLRTLRRQVERLRSLMLLDVGSLVHMEGKGVGTITEVNFELGRYKVDFERIRALTIGFKAGAKLLQPIPDGHILRNKLEDPARLEQLRDEEPSELLREVLESYPNPLTASQIKAALEGVVPPKRWSRWWTAARKHPQVMVSSDKRHQYRWAASSDDAADALRAAFEGADLEDRLKIFGKNAPHNPDLARDMAATLARVGEALAHTDPARALAVWQGLARVNLADADAAFSPAAIVRATDNVAALVERLPQRALRELVYAQVTDEDTDWTATLTACALSEDDPPLVGRLVERLAEEDPELRERIIDRALSRPQEHPGAFVWLARAAGDDDELRRARPLRLFRQLLSASDRDQLASYRTALAPLIESGGTLPKLVADLSEDEAQAALDAVKRSTLEDYLKTPLVNAIELRFDALREHVDDGLYALRESIEARRAEARELQEVEIPANRRAIQEAVALGDLRENFEYKSARQRHEYLSARLAGLQADLSRVQPINLETVGDTEVRIGSMVELKGPGGTRRITVLGPWESDPDAGLISYQSDIGKALIGRKPGDRVDIDGGSFEIVLISTHGQG